MLLDDLGVKQGEELLVVVNGAGATTLMELLILFRRVHQVLAEKKDQTRTRKGRRVHYHAGASGLPAHDFPHGSGIDRTLGCSV